MTVYSLEAADRTIVVNHLLHYLFSQCSATLNGVCVSSSTDLYSYRECLETTIYGQDASHNHLMISFWYPDGDFQSTTHQLKQETAVTTSCGRWRIRVLNERRPIWRAALLLPGAQFQLKFTKSKIDLYVLSSKGDAGPSSNSWASLCTWGASNRLLQSRWKIQMTRPEWRSRVSR